MSHLRCSKHGRVCLRCFVFTAGFPVEHYLWEKAPLFRNITILLGL